MPSISSLIAQFQSQFSAARAANEQRYNQQLKLLRKSLKLTRSAYSDALRLTKNEGKKQLRELKQYTEQAKGVDEQDMIARGLGSSTLLTSARARRDTEYQNAKSDIRDSAARARAGLLTERAGALGSIYDKLAGAIAGRTDAYPDTNAFASMLSQLGAANAGGGGGRGVAVNRTPTNPLQGFLSKFDRGGGDGGGGGAYQPVGLFGPGFGSPQQASAAGGGGGGGSFNPFAGGSFYSPNGFAGSNIRGKDFAALSSLLPNGGGGSSQQSSAAPGVDQNQVQQLLSQWMGAGPAQRIALGQQIHSLTGMSVPAAMQQFA